MIRDNWFGLSPIYWWCIVPPLSTDLLADFYTDMGLFFVKPQVLQPILRQVILENRNVFEGWMSGTVETTDKIGAVSTIGPELEQRAGRDVAALFQIWCTDVFTIDPDDNPNWFCYEQAFERWSFRWRQEKVDSLGFGAAGPSLFQRYETIVDGKELHDAFSLNAIQRPSEWDEILFSITHYTQNDTWPKEGETGLYSSVFQTIYRNRFQIFWETSRDLLIDDMEGSVYRAAQAIFEEYSKKYKRFASIGKAPLAKPKALRRKLPLPENHG